MSNSVFEVENESLIDTAKNVAQPNAAMALLKRAIRSSDQGLARIIATRAEAHLAEDPTGEGWQAVLDTWRGCRLYPGEVHEGEPYTNAQLEEARDLAQRFGLMGQNRAVAVAALIRHVRATSAPVAKPGKK